MLLFEQIEMLTDSEKEKFQKWLKLELANREAKVLQMAVYLLENEDSELSVSPMFKNRVIRSKLLHKLQEFIAIEAFKKDQAQKDLYFMKAIFERKKEHHFPKFYKKVQNRLTKQFALSANYFYYLFQFEWFNHVYALNHTPRKEAKEDFIGKRIHYFVDWIKHELALLELHFFQTQPKQRSFLELLEWLSKRRNDKGSTEELDLFFALKDLFQHASTGLEQANLEQKVLTTLQHSQPVSKSKSFTDFQIMAVNHFIRKADENPVEISYLQLKELYNWMLENQLIPFTVHTFRTMSLTFMNLANLQKDPVKKQLYLDQAQAFMLESKTKLSDKEQDNAFTFMKAHQEFINKNYHQVAKGNLFRSSEKIDPYYEYGYQFILFQSEYELGKTEELSSSLRYLGDRIRKRKGLTERSRKIHVNRIRFFRKLLRKNDLEELVNLEKEIKKTRLLGGRVWLLEKIKEKKNQFLSNAQKINFRS